MDAIHRVELKDMMKYGIRAVSAIAVSLIITAGQTQPLAMPLGHFQDWDGYQAPQDQGSYCYILSTPKTSDPMDAHISITRFKRRGLDQQVNISFGTPIDDSKPVKAVIDGHKRFELQGHGQSGGWFADIEQEKKFVDALKKGEWLVVEAHDGDAGILRHRYSLFGVTAAHSDMAKRCS